MSFVSPTEDVKNILVSNNIGVFGVDSGNDNAWSIFIGSEPEEPNNCVTLYDAPGEPANPKWLIDYPRILVRVRSHIYVSGYQKAEEIKSQLVGLPSQDIGSIRYVGVWSVVDPHFLRADGKGRSIFVSTLRMIREPSEGEHRQPL